MGTTLSRRYGPVVSLYLAIAAIATAVTILGYLRLLGQQGGAGGDGSRVAWVVVFLVAMVTLAGVGAVTPRADARAVLAAACTGGLVLLGVAAAFSIGLPLLAAGVLALVGWFSALRERPEPGIVAASVAASVAAPIVLLIGFALTA